MPALRRREPPQIQTLTHTDATPSRLTLSNPLETGGPRPLAQGNMRIGGSLTEVELVERSRRGDQRAFRALYDRHVDRTWRLAFRLLGDEEVARECVQDTFVRAYQRLDQFRGESSFATWLHTVTVRLALNRRKSLRQMQGREVEFSVAEDTVPADNGPAPAPALRRRIEEAVDELPDIYRTVFVLYDLEGFTHEEIAGRLDIAIGTSKARLSRARTKLRVLLGDLIEECVG
jgi:RNA polymerase sigma-70 factor (ECF subfamily)